MACAACSMASDLCSASSLGLYSSHRTEPSVLGLARTWHLQLANVLAGGGDVEHVSLLQTRAPTAVPSRVSEGEAAVQTPGGFGLQPSWSASAQPSDLGEAVARNISQALGLVMQYAKDSHALAEQLECSTPPCKHGSSANRNSTLAGMAAGSPTWRARQHAQVPLFAAEGRSSSHHAKRRVSLQSLEAFRLRQHHEDAVPWGELARAIAAMAAEATASVGEGFEGLPQPGLAALQHAGGNLSIGPGNLSLSYAQEGPDVTDQILTPAALGAAVGVVVGAAVGVN